MIQKIQDIFEENFDVFLSKKQIIFGFITFICAIIFIVCFATVGKSMEDDVNAQITPPRIDAPLFEKK